MEPGIIRESDSSLKGVMVDQREVLTSDFLWSRCDLDARVQQREAPVMLR